PSPVREYFDYLPPSGVNASQLQPGLRVKIPFGRRILIGIIISIETSSAVAPQKLKPAINIIDETPLFDEKFIKLCQWTSEYYHYSLGEILGNALPTTLRRDIPADKPGTTGWRLTKLATTTPEPLAKRGKRHLELIALLSAHPDGLPEKYLLSQGFTQQVIYYLARYDYLEPFTIYPEENQILLKTGAIPQLNKHQELAVNTINQSSGYQAFLLDGITGSGKTEVYLRAITEALKQDKQALILVPEISLTPQTVERFAQRFNTQIVTLHSGLNHRQRSENWLAAKHGNARIIIGTRSAIFTPMENLGIIIVDEEHDISFKQQDSFRYSARDVAVMRAHLENIPIVLGSATPSLESIYNAQTGRYQLLNLPERAGNANPPQFKLIDIKQQRLEEGLSKPLINAMKKHLERGNQVLLFLNRRGYAPVMICHDCGWIAACAHCDARYTLHWKSKKLRCHHCEHEQPLIKACPKCTSHNLIFLGQGTERIEDALAQNFSEYQTVRIDRDNTRKKGALHDLLNQVHEGTAQILVGTQMLAKGHHFPNVTLVAILDADSGLFSIDFRASERIGQLLMQVSGRAGRCDQAGEVLIQTRHPDHPLLQQLVTQGYNDFARAALAERELIGLPPYGYIAMMRAESRYADEPLNFLEFVSKTAKEYSIPGVQLLGPVPAPMEKRAGRYRGQLLFQAQQRKSLQQMLKLLTDTLGTSKISRGVRWSLDVDPQEMF
ncbi:MAG: primosomal protein N', partial [Gammaproteobacteria bacterium]